VNSQRRSDGVRARKPRLAQERRRALSPQVEEPREAGGEQGRERLWQDLAAKRRALPVGQHRRSREVDPETDGDAVAAPFEQDPGELLSPQKQVVGPFEEQRLARVGDVHRFRERKAGDERKSLRGGIAGAQIDDRAPIEIPGDRQPRPALPPPARLLVKRDQPIAFDGIGVGNDVGVGRAGPVDGPDTGQNRLPAARSANVVSGPISKYPRGETNKAASRISDPCTGSRSRRYGAAGSSMYMTLMIFR